jgi:hypothetical protein
MLLAWAMVLPVGVTIAILRKSFDEAKGQGSWISYHMNLQYSGVGIGLIGSIVAFAMVDGSHCNVTHGVNNLARC